MIRDSDKWFMSDRVVIGIVALIICFVGALSFAGPSEQNGQQITDASNLDSIKTTSIIGSTNGSLGNAICGFYGSGCLYRFTKRLTGNGATDIDLFSFDKDFIGTFIVMELTTVVDDTTLSGFEIGFINTTEATFRTFNAANDLSGVVQGSIASARGGISATLVVDVPGTSSVTDSFPSTFPYRWFVHGYWTAGTNKVIARFTGDANTDLTVTFWFWIKNIEDPVTITLL